MITPTEHTTCHQGLASSRGRICVSAPSHAMPLTNAAFVGNGNFWYRGEDTVRTTKYHWPREASMT